MPVIMTDNRAAAAMTIQEADELFARIATDEIELARIAAQYEKRIAAIKADAEAVLGPVKARIAERAAKLAAYIEAHKDDRFVKPRNRKTSFGTYGLRAVSNVEVTDLQLLLADLTARGLTDCFEVNTRIAKAAVGKQLEAGVELSGAEIRSGVRAEYKVDKALIDEAADKVPGRTGV